jgi:hypothetical protein
MALSKIDVANMLTGVTPVANGGTARTAMTGTPIQIVTAYKSDENTLSTSASVADVANLTCSITPTSTSNYVYVTAIYHGQLFGNNSTTTPNGEIQLLNNADTVLCKTRDYETFSANNQIADFSGTLEAYYNPNTTSEISFNLAILSNGGRFLIYGDNNSYMTKPTQITAMEISA